MRPSSHRIARVGPMALLCLMLLPNAFANEPGTAVTGKGHGTAGLKTMLARLDLAPQQVRIRTVKPAVALHPPTYASPFANQARNVRWTATKRWSDDGKPAGGPRVGDSIRVDWLSGCYQYVKELKFLRTSDHRYAWAATQQSVSVLGLNRRWGAAKRPKCLGGKKEPPQSD